MIVITARLINTAMLAEGPRLGNRKAPAHPRLGREAMADGIIGRPPLLAAHGGDLKPPFMSLLDDWGQVLQRVHAKGRQFAEMQ